MKMSNLRSARHLLIFLFLLIAVPAFAESQPAVSVKEEAVQFIEANYVEEVGQDVLQKESIAEIIEALDDPYAMFFTAEEYEDFLISTGGAFGGVGMRLAQEGDYVIVFAPLPGTPAEKAGLQPGDKILMVNDIDVVGRPLDEVVHLIRGEPGTVVIVIVMREGEEEPCIFSLSREIIDLDMTEEKLIEEKIGYIRLQRFSKNASSDLKKQIEELKRQGAGGYILDLRNNPGGYLTAAMGVSSVFLPKENLIMHIISRAGRDTTYVSTSPALNVPLILLVNEGSASASEIVAGAIQDNCRGLLVGTKTFGKGSVQTVMELSDGSAIKLTTAKYLTPDKREINGTGITPDYVVEEPEEQLEKAVALLKEEIARLNPVVNIILAVGKGKVLINQAERELPQLPYIAAGCTMVPVRFIAEAFGAEVLWNGAGRTVNITLDGVSINLTVGKKQVTVNGEEQTITVPPAIKNGTAFVPTRFIAEALGAGIAWDTGSRTVNITSK